MTTNFVAPVLALALLVIAASVGKPPGERVVFPEEKPRQLIFAEEESWP